MASYLTGQQSQQFSPYIPQYNPQDYEQTLQTEAQVGMSKQQSYNQNVQRIQGSIYTIAGLQLMKETDKNFLNQKMSDLQANLSKMAGADFSSNQLTQSAMGLAAQIGNDRTIQNAVISTQNYRDGIGQIEEAHKNGKSSQTNDWAVQKHLQSWMQDQTPGASLGKQQYTNFFDYQGGFSSFMKDKNPNTVVYQNPDGTNSAYTLIEGKRVELDPLSVQNDFNTYLSSNSQAKGQLDIDSQYYVDNTDDSAALQSLQGLQTQAQTDYTQKIKELQSQLSAEPSRSAELTPKIEQYQTELNTVNASYNQRVAEFQANPTLGKTKLYQTNIALGMGQRYAYSDLEQKTVANPLFNAQLDEAQFQLATTKFKWQQEMDLRNYQLAKDKAEGKLTAAPVPISATGYDANGQITADQYIQDTKDALATSAQEEYGMLYSINPQLFKVGKDANGGTLYILNNGVSQQQIDKEYADVQNKYQSNPDGVNANVRAFFGQSQSDLAGIGRKNAVDARMMQINNIDNQYSFNNLDVNTELLEEGGVKVTKGDLLKYANFEKNSIDKGISNDNQTISSQTGLPADKVALLKKYINHDTGRPFVDFLQGGTALIADTFPSNSPAGNLRKEYKNLLDFSNSPLYQQKQKAYADILKNNAGLSVTETVTDKNQGAYNQIVDLATAMANNGQSGNLDALKAVETAKGDHIRVSVEKLPSGNFRASVRKGDAFHSMTIPVDRVQLMAPGLLASDPQSAWRNRIMAQNNNNSGITTTLSGYETPTRTNNKEYNYRYTIKKGPGDWNGPNYTPKVQYQKKGTGTWTDLPWEPDFTSLEGVNTVLGNIWSMDPVTFQKAINP